MIGWGYALHSWVLGLTTAQHNFEELGVHEALL